MGKNIKVKGPVIPLYAVFPLLACITVNFIVYCGTDYITGGWKHYDLTLPIDRAVPVVPAFVSVYLGCYVFWIVNYILIARQGEEHCIRFVTADMMSRIVCGLFYFILPTTNVRPEIVGTGVWEILLRQIYQIDAATKLFPSIHCLVSWLSYIGIRGRKNIPKAYRIFSCLFALLVCVSTQLIKQHYILDAVGGIVVAEGTYWAAFHTGIYRYPKRVFDWLYHKVFGRQQRICGKES